MEKVDFVVRKAFMSDIPQILDVSKEAFHMYAEGAGITAIIGSLSETCEYLQEEIKNKLVFVAIYEDVIVGSVRVEVSNDKTAYLSRFGVRGEYQSRGIGKLLMNAVDASMEKLGIERLYLHTASRMLSLVRFYYARGFYIESTNKGNGYIRALLCKEYEADNLGNSLVSQCENLAGF
jgi:ribosomal protein S18 acetylase RimI-like enzyme